MATARRRPPPSAIVNPKHASGTGLPLQTPLPIQQASPQVAALQGGGADPSAFIADPMSAMLLQRANRPEPIRGPVSVLGRLAALGVGQSLERKNTEARKAAVLEATKDMDPNIRQQVLLGVAMGADAGQLMSSLSTAQGHALTARGQDIGERVAGKRIEAAAAEGSANRASREGIAAAGIEAGATVSAAEISSREGIAAATLQLERDELEIKAEENRLKAGVGDNKDANTLMDDFRSESGDFKIQASAMRRMQAAVEDPSGAGDLALVFSFMKVLDPPSSVREGEFANAENSSGVPERIRGIWNKLRGGGRLGPGQRADFMNRAGRMFARARDTQIELEEEFLDIAAARGVDPKLFALDYLRDLRDFEPAPFTPEQSLSAEQEAAALEMGLTPVN